MEDSQKNEIITALKAKGALNPCPRCNKNHFELVGGTGVNINDSFSASHFGGPQIPSILIVCSNCGFLSPHALAPLGLMHLTKGGQ